MDRWTNYWFYITDPIEDPEADWTYYVAIGTDIGSDPDLYVTLFDGRDPSTIDWDLASIQKGADFISISSRDRMWSERGWNTSVGVFVVVGIYETEPTNFNIVLTKRPEAGSAID